MPSRLGPRPRVASPFEAVNNVWMIGCGGIGTHLLAMIIREIYYRKFLMREHGEDERAIRKVPKGNIILVDGDQVEARNLFRQDFLEEEINTPKAEALAERYDPLLREFGTKVEGRKIWVDKGTKIFKHQDVVLMCVDNNVTRKIVNDMLTPEHEDTIIYPMDPDGPHSIAMISGGNRENLATVHVTIVRDGKIITAPIEHNQPDITNPTDKHPKDEDCMSVKTMLQDPQVFRANHQAATMMFNSFINLLDGKDFDYCQLWSDVGDMSFRKEPIPEPGKWVIEGAVA